MVDRDEGLRVEERADVVGRCPYCHDALATSLTCGCDHCGTVLHARCREEHRGCTTQGCVAAPPPRPPSRPSTPTAGPKDVDLDVLQAVDVVEVAATSSVLRRVLGNVLFVLFLPVGATLPFVLAIGLGYGILVGGAKLDARYDLPSWFMNVVVVTAVLSPVIVMVVGSALSRLLARSHAPVGGDGGIVGDSSRRRRTS